MATVNMKKIIDQLLVIFLKHKFTYEALVDIMEIINSLFSRNIMRATKYFFLKAFGCQDDDAKFYYQCHIYSNDIYLNISTKFDVSACNYHVKFLKQRPRKSISTISINEIASKAIFIPQNLSYCVFSNKYEYD
jgi:hypothetical protein